MTVLQTGKTKQITLMEPGCPEDTHLIWTPSHNGHFSMSRWKANVFPLTLIWTLSGDLSNCFSSTELTLACPFHVPLTR